MKFRLARTALVAGSAVAALAVGVTPALAATTYTVKAGTATTGTAVAFKGATSGTSPQVTFVDTTTNTTLTCASSTAPGSTTVGTGLSGTAIASITGASTTWTTCTGPFGLAFTVTGSGSWKLNATSGSSTGASGNISGISASVADPGVCSFTVSGTVAGSYTNSTKTLALPGTTSGLTIAGVPSGQCFGVINTGDKASFKANYVVTATTTAYNPISITSP